MKNLIDEDFSNYKHPAMFLGFPSCSFKCEKESGIRACQNSSLASAPTIGVSVEDLYERFVNNSITQAVVCGGLEPFDTFDELLALVSHFRERGCSAEFVVYTGYYPDEIMDRAGKLTECGNIVIKYGRFVPSSESKYDDVLGVTLASKNQFAVAYK